MTSKSAVGDISVCKPLIRTNTTLDHSQKAERYEMKGNSQTASGPGVVSDECEKKCESFSDSMNKK